MAVPAGKRAPDEVVQAEFGLQLGVLLLDGPPLMRQIARPPASEAVVGRLTRKYLVSAVPSTSRWHRSQTSGAETPAAPVVSGRDAAAPEAGAPRALRPIAPATTRHARAGAAAASARTVCAARRGHGVGASSAGRAGACCAGTRSERGGAEKDRQRRRHAHAHRRAGAVQRVAKRRAIAEFGIGGDRGHLDLRGAHLLQQRQRLAPLLLEADPRRNAAAVALGRRRATRRAGTAGRRPATPGRRSTTPPSRPPGNCRSCPACPEYCRCDADRRRPLLRKARAIEHEHARARRNRARAAAATARPRPTRLR